MTADPHVAALTMILAPRGETDDVLSILVDYSAVGPLDPFVWIDSSDVGKASVPAILVADGRTYSVVLQQMLTDRRYQRVRIATLVPVDAPAEQIPCATEQELEQVVHASALDTPITLLRLLFTHGAVDATGYPNSLVLEGWHNLLVAPEDPAGPGLGSVPLDRCPTLSMSPNMSPRCSHR